MTSTFVPRLVFCKRVCLAVGVAASLQAISVQADDATVERPVQAPASIAAMHSDIKFAFVAPARKEGDVSVEAFFAQARRIAATLTTAGAGLYPEAIGRIGKFDVFVADSREVSVLSSATGRIALNAGFADLKPTDDWLALVVAREMGHVIAGHHSDNSTASIITSVLMNLILPGSGLIKSAISFAGSQLAAESGREKQAAEADDIAVKLLEAAGYMPKALALNLALGPTESQLGTSSWAKEFSVSAKNVIARVRGRPDGPLIALPSPQPVEIAAVPAAGPAMVASTDAHLRVNLPAARLPAEEIVMRTRPSGMPGPLMLGGGHLVPARRVE